MTKEEIKNAAKAAFQLHTTVDKFHVLETGDCFENEQPAKFAAKQLPAGKQEVHVFTRTDVGLKDSGRREAKPEAPPATVEPPVVAPSSAAIHNKKSKAKK